MAARLPQHAPPTAAVPQRRSCRRPCIRRRLAHCCAGGAAASAAEAATSLASALPRVPRARTRLHVNPLSPALLQPPAPPDWPSLLAQPELPLHLDLGCAYGEFALALAALHAGALNVVGVDVRERVLARAAALRAPNAAFLLANARHPAFLPVLLAAYPGALVTVSCLFADPWSQSRFIPRRLLQPDLVAAVAAAMPPGGAFVTATDNAGLAAEMRAAFEVGDAAQMWRRAHDVAEDGWARASPFRVATQWECTARARGARVYWGHFQRTDAML